MPPSFSGGGGGLSNVITDATLAGAGTGASPLGVKNWPLTFFSRGIGASSSGINAGLVNGAGFTLEAELTFSHVVLSIATADVVNNYDAGIYSKAGALLANIGKQHLPSTGTQSFAALQGSVTLSPGLYIFAWTTDASTVAGLYYDLNAIAWIHGASFATGSGGTLPASIGAQVVAPSNVSWVFGLY